MSDLRDGLRFLGRFRHHRRRAMLVCFCGAAASALQLLVPLSSMVLINRVLPEKDFRLLALLAAGLAAATLLSLLAGYGEIYLGTILRERISLELQRDLFEHLQRLPFSFFKCHQSGYVMSRLINDPETAVDFPAGLTSLGRTLVWFGAAFCVMPVLHPIIGLVVALLIPLYVVLLVSFNRRIKERFTVVQEKTARASQDLFESLTGIYETKAYTREGFWARRYVRALAAKVRALIRGRQVMALASHSTQGVMVVVSLFLLTYGGLEVMRGALSLGGLVALNAMVGYLLLPINGLVQQAFGMQRSLAAVERLNEILSLQPESRRRGPRPTGKAAGHLRFAKVSFCYEGGEMILRDIDFVVAAGEKVLFMGPSGEGKSSLMSLLPRFFIPDRGRIYLDGRPIDELDLEWLRRQIAFVSQDTFLFSDTVFNNIRIGRLEASPQEVRDAAKLANALGFIEALPDGFSTLVGERGCRLSGGQRQRIAIARALLRQAPILVLDEATSAVDRETEEALYEALDRLIEGRTTLVVAHHTEAFLHRVDRLFEVREGRVRELRAPGLERRCELAIDLGVRNAVGAD
jgi:ABC-type multidrug transport system fused ATPase/permease subunit